MLSLCCRAGRFPGGAVAAPAQSAAVAGATDRRPPVEPAVSQHRQRSLQDLDARLDERAAQLTTGTGLNLSLTPAACQSVCDDGRTV